MNPDDLSVHQNEGGYWVVVDIWSGETHRTAATEKDALRAMEELCSDAA